MLKIFPLPEILDHEGGPWGNWQKSLWSSSKSDCPKQEKMKQREKACVSKEMKTDMVIYVISPLSKPLTLRITDGDTNISHFLPSHWAPSCQLGFIWCIFLVSFVLPIYFLHHITLYLSRWQFIEIFVPSTSPSYPFFILISDLFS